MEYLIGIIAVLLGGFFLERNKRKSSESLNENIETKKKILDISSSKAKIDAELKLEEEKRKLIQENTNEKNNNKLDSDLLDFFNKPRK